jgi:hypothetical protein
MTNNTRSRSKGRGRVLTSAWPYGRWSNPMFAAFEVYVCGTLVKTFNINWLYVLGAGAVCVATISLMSLVKHVKRLGLIYGAALATAVTAWLVWAAKHTTFSIHDAETTKRSMLIVSICSIPFAIIYAMLLHDRVKTTAKKDKIKTDTDDETEQEYWESITSDAGIKKWRLVGEDETDNGVIVHMQILPGGTSYRQSLLCIDRLETNIGVDYAGAVRIMRGEKVNLVSMVVNNVNVLAERIDYCINATPNSITNSLTLGIHENGRSASTVFAYRSTSTFGQREGGKSNYQNVTVAEFGRCTDVLLFMVDFKRGSVAKQWLAPYAAGLVDKPLIDWVVLTPEGVDDICDALIKIGDSRAARRTGDKIKIGPATPAIRLLIDEIADLLTDQKWSHVANKLMLILRKMRSEGIDVDIFSQRGTMSFLGNHGRDFQSQTRTTTLFRLDNAGELYNSIGLSKDRLGGVDPSTFEYQGTALIVTDDIERAPVKILRIDNEQIIEAATRYAPFRPEMPLLDRQAAGRAYERRWSTPEMRSLLCSAAELVGGTYNPAHVTSHDAQIIALPNRDDDVVEDEPDVAPATTESEKLKQYNMARSILTTMEIMMARVEAMPTSTILDRLSARSKDWAALTPKTLAGYMRMVRVAPKRLGGEFGHGSRGYVTSDIRAASRWVKDHSVQSVRENL